MKPVVVVGAGLSGLSCARALHERGIEVCVLEGSDAVGGRVRTDQVDGYRLDRGFQVLLTSYPEARRQLDLESLDLRAFDPGAVLWTGERFETIGDPLRRVAALVPTLLARAATLRDKIEVLRLRRDVLAGTDYGAFEGEDVTTLVYLRQRGFSDRFIERFFRPFLGGVFLDGQLGTTSRFFRFVFRMFSEGRATVPARGMAEIPLQIAADLPDGTITFNARVESVDAHGVGIAGGHRIEASAVVVATEGPAARRLVPDLPQVTSRGVTCFYFGCDQPPTDRPALHLYGSGRGPINNLHVASAVSPAVAPAGKHLVSVSCLGVADYPHAQQAQVLRQAQTWFGERVRDWTPLRHYAIPHALPAQPVGSLEPPRRPARRGTGVYLCGDHLDQASIDGALVSGRRAAEAVASDLRATKTG